MSTDRTVRILKELSRKLERLSAEQLSILDSGNFEIELIIAPSRSKSSEAGGALETERAIAQLSDYETREEALAALDKIARNKKEAELVARSLDIPIQKQDKLDVLKARIVEATVGAKIRSSAIRGVNSPEAKTKI